MTYATQNCHEPLTVGHLHSLHASHHPELGTSSLQIVRAILENEVTRRVGPPHRPNPSAGCVRWGKQPGYVVFAGQKIPLERPRVRSREGQEVELEATVSYNKTENCNERCRSA